MKAMDFFSLIIVCLFISSCNSKLSKHEREELKKELTNKEVMIGRTGEVYHIMFNLDTNMITFSFRDNKLSHVVLRDSVPEKARTYIQDLLKSEAEKTFRLINKYNLVSSTESFVKHGIPLEFSMKDNNKYIFCPDTTLLDSSWIEYVRESTFLDNGWYYKKAN